MLRVWTKRVGQRHYSKDGMSETLCGRPMLGNNYADVIPESEQEECEECLEVLKKETNVCSENCSSCDDIKCLFHKKNYDEKKIMRLLEEKLKEKERSDKNGT